MPRDKHAGGTPLGAVVGYAARGIEWRPFMSVAEVARLSGVSPKTLLRWLVEEPGLWDACGIRARGQRWIRTEAFRRWMAGELVLAPSEEAPIDEVRARRNEHTA